MHVSFIPKLNNLHGTFLTVFNYIIYFIQPENGKRGILGINLKIIILLKFLALITAGNVFRISTFQHSTPRHIPTLNLNSCFGARLESQSRIREKSQVCSKLVSSNLIKETWEYKMTYYGYYGLWLITKYPVYIFHIYIWRVCCKLNIAKALNVQRVSF